MNQTPTTPNPDSQATKAEANQAALRAILKLVEAAGIGPVATASSCTGDDIVDRVRRLVESKKVAEQQWDSFAKQLTDLKNTRHPSASPGLVGGEVAIDKISIAMHREKTSGRWNMHEQTVWDAAMRTMGEAVRSRISPAPQPGVDGK